MKQWTQLFLFFSITSMLLSGCNSDKTPADLQRWSLTSQLDGSERDYFVYLPQGYGDDPKKEWPLILFLHGNGERGNGKSELDFVITHGPLFEAWVQKRDLPFVIITPQMPMFNFAETHPYFSERKIEDVPKRQDDGVPARTPPNYVAEAMNGILATEDMSTMAPLLPQGWETIEADLLAMLDRANSDLTIDTKRTYITGLSYGGFGTWYMTSRHPERFAAAAPIAGWGHPSLIPSIAEASVPVWCFAGGLDTVVPLQHFYPGLNALRLNTNADVRFTVHEDLAHDVWRRVYASQELYQWLLSKHN